MNPIIRNEPPTTLTSLRDWEPLRQLRELLRFDPFTPPLGEVCEHKK